jgi:hypothetical protein
VPFTIEDMNLSNDIQVLIILPTVGAIGFALSIFWGRVTRPDTFDRDTIAFLGKMWTGIAGGFVILYFLLKYKVL